ncbi:hypothetical protein ACPF8X_06150 [Streptomyces sp. G35A]
MASRSPQPSRSRCSGAKNKQGVALSTDPRAIAENPRTITPRREDDAWRQVTAVDIPEVGVAARTFGVEDVPVAQGDSRTLRMVLTQTYIPVPGAVDQVVLVSGPARCSISPRRSTTSSTR